MFPLILLALGLGVALTAYEISPKVRARINDYALALRAAHEAHVAADAHLDNANRARETAAQHAGAAIEATQTIPPPPLPVAPAPMPFPPPPLPAAPAPMPLPPSPLPAAPAAPAAPTLAPHVPPEADAHAGAAAVAADAGLDHAVKATISNEEAAQSTVEMAKHAKTPDERRAVVASATKVDDRAKKIAAAYASLGVGQCDVRSYPHATPQIRDTLLAKLHAEGMTVTGDNPWDIDTHQSDVKLRAAWNPKTQTLKLIVLDGTGGLPFICDEVWKRLEPKLKEIIKT